MEKNQVLQNFIAAELTQASVLEFFINLILATVFSIILRKSYIKYGKSLSNRDSFSDNFILITLTTMLIINIVQTSLALSLGLIGALSIVRFRSAIKEPEELAYLFLAIAIGLGFGANQKIVTITSVVFILLVLFLRNYNRKKIVQNLYISIYDESESLNLEVINKILHKNCSKYLLKRFDKKSNICESTYLIEFQNDSSLQLIDEQFRLIDKNINISFIDNQGFYQ